MAILQGLSNCYIDLKRLGYLTFIRLSKIRLNSPNHDHDHDHDVDHPLLMYEVPFFRQLASLQSPSQS